MKLRVNFEEVSMPIKLLHHIQLAMPAEREAKRGFSVLAFSGYSKVHKPDTLARRTRVCGSLERGGAGWSLAQDFRPRESTPASVAVSSTGSMVLLACGDFIRKLLGD